MLAEDGKVRLVCNIVERMNLSTVLSAYSSKGRKPVLDPITFLKVILFSYSEGIFHSRKNEAFCKYDLRGHFIIGGRKAPDHSTICRFEQMPADHSQDLLTEFVHLLQEDGHVDLKTLYIDGTKIESYANRYNFVWRKSVEKNQKKLMGSRNSDSKTNHDTTFIRMKADHMLNGQLKPAYNIQLASSGAFIVGVMGSQKPNDLHTLKPFLKQMLPAYGKSLKNIVADAGYESEENYTYLETNNLAAYIKPSNYETKKKRITKQNIGRRKNMLYLEDQDAYVCKAGKYLARGKDRKTKTASGYVDTVWTYTCRECGGCPHASECIRTRNSVSPTHKSIQFSPSFEQYRMQSEANIMSDVGINHRINLNKLHSKMLNNQTEIIVYKKTA